MQQYQSVVINNENLEHHGQAGHVVEAVKDGKVGIRIDSDGEVYEFDVSHVRAL
jgi:hypothetical protein